MSIEIKPLQNKISVLWYYFDDTDDYHIKICKLCGELLALVTKDHQNYLHHYLVHTNQIENHHQQYLNLIYWAEKNNYTFRNPGPQSQKVVKQHHLHFTLNKNTQNNTEILFQEDIIDKQ